MADLISRAAAIGAFMGKPPEYYHTSYIVGELNCVPAVDAVPVVRCRDCKYWYAEIGASTGWLPCQEIVTDSNWFCGSGKRRDGA